MDSSIRVYPGRARSRRYPFREIINALLYKLGTRCAWSEMPEVLPQQYTVWYYYKLWQEDGRLEELSRLLGKDLSALTRGSRRYPRKTG